MGIVDGVRFCDACGTTVSRDEPLHADSFGREICGDCLSKLDGCDLDIKSTLNSTPGAQEIAQEPGRALNAVGNTDAVCPHCDHTLEKKPGRKKKCPHCCHFIYVRTRPSDRQRVLVTEAQAEQIEEQWSIANGTHDAFMAKTNRFADEKAKLKKRFGGGEPSDNDVRWGLLNQERTEHAGQRDWGLYSNATFEMAELLKKEGKTTRALQFYLEVCYHDLNGPNNTGGVTDKDLLREFPPWDPGGRSCSGSH